MLNSGTRPPKGVNEIVHGIDRPAGRVGGDRGEERGVEDAEANFLAFHVAVRDSDPKSLMDGIAAAFRPPTHERSGQKQRHHRTPHSPSRAFDSLPSGQGNTSARCQLRKWKASGRKLESGVGFSNGCAAFAFA